MSTRTLSIVPILHTEADLGALAESLRASMGEQAWAEKQRQINETWDRIEDWINQSLGDRTDVRLYQDGLPVCGREIDIVRDLAAQGSRNHALLLGLVDRGAVLEGTESGELLIEELDLAKAAAAGTSPPHARDRRARAILERRDAFIADRIMSTLGEGEHGLLFIGMLHRVEQHLDSTIDVRHPFRGPGERRSA